jgi:hypothetical protein
MGESSWLDDITYFDGAGKPVCITEIRFKFRLLNRLQLWWHYHWLMWHAKDTVTFTVKGPAADDLIKQLKEAMNRGGKST